MRAATTVDVLYLTDLRFPGGSSTSLVHEVESASAAGYRVAAIQCRSTSLRAERGFHSQVRSLIDDGRLLLIRPGERVQCGLAVVKHPTVMALPMGGRLPIDAAVVVVFAGQVPVDPDGTVHYDPAVVHSHVEESLGVAPVWQPVSPVVRRSLAASGVPVAGSDWVEVIDAEPWEAPREGPVGTVPVIGRHGRPTVLKWPDDPTDFAAVYPLDGSATVRVLGGTDGLDAVLDSVPDSWEVHAFGSMEPSEFLAGVDFFVYFHHRDLVEAFGRTIIEALAAGCVVVLPPHFEEVFGPACVYAEPSEVSGVVDHLHGDAAAYLAQSRCGREAVNERFSHGTHVRRIRELVGDAGEATGRVAPGANLPAAFRRQRPTVIVSCVGSPPEVTARVLVTAVTHRDLSAGFVPLVVSDQPAPLIAAHLDEDLELDGNARLFRGSTSGVTYLPVDGPASPGPEPWQDRLLSQIQLLVRRYEVTSISVGDPASEAAWLPLEVLAGPVPE